MAAGVLDKDRRLKPEQDLIGQRLDTSWWPIMQIQYRYERNSKMYVFFNKEQTTFDQIILTSDDKLIWKAYKFILNWKMEDE